jgi:hypothetical protein
MQGPWVDSTACLMGARQPSRGRCAMPGGALQGPRRVRGGSVKASAGPSGAPARRQAIDATDFDAKARTIKPHVNDLRDKRTV